MGKTQAVLLLRWVLIIATSYLVLFSRPLGEVRPRVAVFVALYLASNVVLSALLPRVRWRSALDIGVVLFDTVAVSVGLLLTRSVSSDFFLLYFVVMFLGALSESLGLVVGAAMLISVVHLYTISRFVGIEHVLASGYMLRVPFLLVAALFFGHLVENSRSRQRAADEAQARERLRTEFVSAVIHDLKNPIWLVQSLAQHLLEGCAGALSERQGDFVRRIHANARHVINLSLNLLDAARIEAGRLALQRTPAKLPDVVEDAVSLARSAAELKGIKVCTSFQPGVPGVSIDVMQMERVLSNLLDNAIKYSPAGGVVIIRVRRHRNQMVALSVFNAGAGIPPDELEAVFEKYLRRGVDGRVSGSGLGLFIVKAIAEAHGGTVEAESAVGQGTEITVCLPASGEAGNGNGERAPRDAAELAPAGARGVVAEDAPMVAVAGGSASRS